MMLLGIIKAGWWSLEFHCSVEFKQEELISDCTHFYLCSIITVIPQFISETQCLLVIK